MTATFFGATTGLGAFRFFGLMPSSPSKGCLRLAALCLIGLGASSTYAQVSSFRDDFSASTLDPAWLIQSGIGSYSLSANPGHLRYSLAGSTNPAGDSVALWIYRPFSGTNWTLETRVSYYMPLGNGRQLYLKVPLGDLSQRNTNEVWWWREADQYGGVASNCCTYVTFFDGGVGTNVGPMNIDAADTYIFRLRRSGQTFTAWMSPDGNTWTLIATHSYTTAIGSSQNVLLSGANFAGAGYADYDYVSVQGAGSFIPVTPCRVADTRNATGVFGGPAIAGMSSRSFPISSSSCGIPSDAIAYSLNITAVPHGPLGYLTLWPTGEQQPLVSTLNAVEGQVVANAAIVPAGGGATSVFVTNTADVVIDINGYFASTP